MTADVVTPKPDAHAIDPIERELREIEDLCRRALANRDILYCSPAVRHLVEKEVPRLIGIVRDLQSSSTIEAAKAVTDPWVQRMLRELRPEIDVVRDLVERR